LAREVNQGDDAGVHADGVHRAGLDAEAAEDAAGEVDVEAYGLLHDGGIGMLARLDGDAFGRAHGGAAHAGDAADGAVFARHQAVTPSPALIHGLFLVGIPERDRVFERVREVLEEMSRGYRDPPENLGKIEPFEEVEFRFYRHCLSFSDCVAVT